MPSEDKLEKLLTQLIKATTKGDLEWERASPPKQLLHASEDVIDEYFEGIYKKQMISVFERKFRTFDPEHEVTLWTSRDAFAFIDDEDRSVTWETSSPQWKISSLLIAARESAVNVEGIVDALLE